MNGINHFDNFPPEMLFQVFFKLPLEGIKNTSLACKKFAKVLSSESFWKRYFPKVVPTNASYAFLEKYGSKLSFRQLAQCNFNHAPEKMKELGKKWGEEGESQQLFFKLVYSIHCLEKQVFEGREWKKYEGQRNHAHMLMCWGDSEFAFQMHSMKQGILNDPIEKNEWAKLKESVVASTDELLFKSDDYQDCCMLFTQSNLYLQVESPQLLIDFYTELWKHYSPCALDPLPTLPQRIGNMFTYMPIEAFTGFCNAISTKKEFGSFGWWYLPDTHLQVFNLAFKNCTVKNLEISLVGDVKKETLASFIDLIKSGDQFLYVRVDSFDLQFQDTQELFNNFDPKPFKNIKSWL